MISFLYHLPRISYSIKYDTFTWNFSAKCSLSAGSSWVFADHLHNVNAIKNTLWVVILRKGPQKSCLAPLLSVSQWVYSEWVNQVETDCRFKKLLHGEAGDFPLKLILNEHQLKETMVTQENRLNCVTQR